MMKLRNILIGLFLSAGVTLVAGDSAQAAISGSLNNPGATGPISTCEGFRCVWFDANCNNLGGNNNPSAATSNFTTQTFVQCSGGSVSGFQTRFGSALNPNGGDYVYWCPFGQIGFFTYYSVDPT